MNDTTTDLYVSNIAHAQLALDEAQAAYVDAVGERDRLKARITDCETRRAGITQRRLAGESSQEETNEFAALGGDITVLRELFNDAQAKVNSLDPSAQRNALAQAQTELLAHQKQVEFDAIVAIVARAREVEAVYVECMNAVWEAAAKRGHRRTFGEVYQIDQTASNLVRYNSFYGLGGR